MLPHFLISSAPFHDKTGGGEGVYRVWDDENGYKAYVDLYEVDGIVVKPPIICVAHRNIDGMVVFIPACSYWQKLLCFVTAVL